MASAGCLRHQPPDNPSRRPNAGRGSRHRRYGAAKDHRPLSQVRNARGVCARSTKKAYKAATQTHNCKPARGAVVPSGAATAIWLVWPHHVVTSQSNFGGVLRRTCHGAKFASHDVFPTTAAAMKMLTLMRFVTYRCLLITTMVFFI